LSDKNTEYELRLIDKYQESVNVYWSALLTINGLLLTFFSIDALSTTYERSLSLNYLLIGSCTLSLWLLIWNFRTIKQHYFNLGKTKVDDMPDVPEDVRKTAHTKEDRSRLLDEYTAKWRHQNLEKVANRRRYMMFRELMFECLLVLETLLVILILVTK